MLDQAKTTVVKYLQRNLKKLIFIGIGLVTLGVGYLLYIIVNGFLLTFLPGWIAEIVDLISFLSGISSLSSIISVLSLSQSPPVSMYVE